MRNEGNHQRVVGCYLKVSEVLDQRGQTELNGEESTKTRRWIPLPFPPPPLPLPSPPLLQKSSTLHSDSGDKRLGKFDCPLGESDYYSSLVSREPGEQRPPDHSLYS